MKFFCKLTLEKPEPGTLVGILFVCLFLFCSAILLVWQITCHRNPSLLARILECWNLGTLTLISYVGFGIQIQIFLAVQEKL